jgi:hypothetical protein
MIFDRKAVEARISELRADDARVPSLRGFEESTADLLEGLVREVDELRFETQDKECPVHVGSVHGREAEELRAGIEKLIETAEEIEFETTTPQRLAYRMVATRRLQELLDDVDARDSLGHLERHDAEVARLTAENDRLRLSLEAKDAVIAAGQRTIDSGNEAFRTLREQWQDERDKLRGENERLRADLVEAFRASIDVSIASKEPT